MTVVGLLCAVVPVCRPAPAQDSDDKQKPAASADKDSPAATTDEKADSPAASDADQDAGDTADIPEDPFPRRVDAPAGIFDGGVEWLNTSGPISLRDLRGKIVLVDFWTYCCINCMHVLPDLKYLEHKYPNQLVVIGVHSAKFDNEKDSKNIRDAVIRYEIEHPVVNDSRMVIWGKFGTRAWPTLALLGPNGKYIGSQSGEGNRELFDTIIGRLVEYHRAKGDLDETPVRFALERDRLAPTPLRYPGKVLADVAGDRLFISDSNHNRIVITSLDGQLRDIVGSGAIGLKNGGYADAQFDHPQGMELVGNTLYVADTENHCLRTVDLDAKQVSTLAGTGEQSRVRLRSGSIDSMALNSPWALKHLDGMLYIAMAGPHQIWSHEIGSDTIGVYAGSGREDILNGSLEEAALAQPSGIATDGENLFVVDSEGSAIRQIGTGDDATVTTVAGTSELPRGQSLFAFGDVDAKGDEARFEHPLGIAWQDGTLYVADAYNHKIRKIDLESQAATTWIGDGTAGSQLQPPRLSEPGGVSIANGTLYIADTNNHRICVANLKTGAMSELNIDGLEPPAPVEPASTPADAGEVTVVDEQAVRYASEITFDVKLHLPEGFKLNPLAPVTWKLTAHGEQALVSDDLLDARDEATADKDHALFKIPLLTKTGKAEYEVQVSYGFCRDSGENGGGLCRIRSQRWRLPLTISDEAEDSTVTLTVPEAK